MAPPRLHEDPLVQLGRLAVGARRNGMPFDEFWQRAVRPDGPWILVTTPCPPAEAIRWPTDRDARLGAYAAAVATREAWRRAYEGEAPARSERAVTELLSVLTSDDGFPVLAAA
jgi:hypothetical protein